MITEALRHCPGLGPARIARLREAGVRNWTDLLAHAELIPAARRRDVLDEIERCQAARDAGNVRYFVERLAPQDKWRILADFHDRTSYFDIETEGLDADARITVIGCWHRGELHTFVEHENLDDFLELLDEVELLVSFNGASFDVPRLLDAFHIPALPCPHVDLRWMCHHRGWKGGLKEITQRLGLRRPTDLADVSGLQAVLWWNAWIVQGDVAARQHLLRYCAADVLLLPLLAQRLIGHEPAAPTEWWAQLPPAFKRA